VVARSDSDAITGGTGGAGRVIWLTPDAWTSAVFTVAGQRRDLTELPPQGSNVTLSGIPATLQVASASVKRSFAVGVLAAVVAVGACSTPVYTTDTAVRDLERQSQITHTQAVCIVTAIRTHFETEIEAGQKANHLTKLPADQLKLEVDGALAAIRAPSSTETDVARRAIASCAPAALR
jgi:hypothetical protein